MGRKLLGFYVNAGIGAVRLAANVTTEAVKLVGSVAERAMGVSRTPSAEPGWREEATATREAAPDAREAEFDTREADPQPPPRAGPRETEPQPPPEADAPRETSTQQPGGETPEPPSTEPAVDYDATPRTPLRRAEELAETVDEESELVAEFAERGAEDGVGADATIDEPWEGYAQMNADAVIARIGEADVAELAVVELYEQAHAKRQTVLQAAERRHRSMTGPGASG